ncbi:MAG: trypsin-like peptidase domain-containing protein [Oscillospiraceae bacterium]|nr:trypsin-like peptidase domain-containing protein [Oscillospiraceae bacterium]
MKKRIFAIILIFAALAQSALAAGVMPQAGMTRAEIAVYIYENFEDLEVINDIPDGAIRDVPRGAAYYDAVYALYRAGILTGADKYGRFYPDRKLTEAEYDTISLRAAQTDRRRYYSLPKELSPEEIFALCSPAVFTIETFDKSGDTVRTGSGFFITSDGTAATNLHVLDGAASAVITVPGLGKFTVKGVSAYSTKENVALLSIDGKDFPWLPVADSDAVNTGATAYSLGSPLGLDGTLSKGLISYVGREVDGQKMLQFTSNISQGSGGGALLDARGRVVGITSSSFTAGETLNLAVPAKHILELTPGRVVAIGNTK